MIKWNQRPPPIQIKLLTRRLSCSVEQQNVEQGTEVLILMLATSRCIFSMWSVQHLKSKTVCFLNKSSADILTVHFYELQALKICSYAKGNCYLTLFLSLLQYWKFIPVIQIAAIGYISSTRVSFLDQVHNQNQTALYCFSILWNKTSILDAYL